MTEDIADGTGHKIGTWTGHECIELTAEHNALPITTCVCVDASPLMM